MKKITDFIRKKLVKKKAFSLIELSLVLLIIGIIIAGVTQSSSLIRKYKLATARQLTQNSPINSMTGLMFWFESTLEQSFDVDIEDGSSVSTWKDLNQSSSTKYNAISSSINMPIYTENCINGLPCLTFDGVDDYIQNTIATSLTSFTIVMVMEYTHADNPAGSYLLSTTSSDPANTGWLFMHIRELEGNMQNGVSYPSSSIIQSVSDLDGISSPYMTVFSEKTGVTVTSRTNKNDQASNLSTFGGTKNISGVILGQFSSSSFVSPFKGKIAEVIMFDRALKVSERNDIEEYLIKKWNINTN